MNNDNEIVKSLVADGVIGAVLGAMIAEDNQEGAAIGAIAGAVLLATLKANEAAKQTQVPLYQQENGTLYQIDADGKKHFIRNIEKPQTKLPKHFILK